MPDLSRTHPLSRLSRTELSLSRTELSRTDLSPILEQKIRSARHRWPNFDIDPCTFAAYIGQRVRQRREDLGEVLTLLASADLYLACGCVHGDSSALAVFYDQYVPYVIRGLYDHLDPWMVSDVHRSVVQQLISDDPPLLEKYSGFVRLRCWLQVVSAHAAWRYIDSIPRERHPIEDDRVTTLVCPVSTLGGQVAIDAS